MQKVLNLSGRNRVKYVCLSRAARLWDEGSLSVHKHPHNVCGWWCESIVSASDLMKAARIVVGCRHGRHQNAACLFSLRSTKRLTTRVTLSGLKYTYVYMYMYIHVGVQLYMYTCVIAILLAKVCMTRCGADPGSIHAAWRVHKVRGTRTPIERLAFFATTDNY